MIERVIENWLTNTNERGYQIPFCQYLISMGYTILGMSFHGPMEQGKDIIAIDEKKIPCAFQLKSGDINEGVWRRIKGEIDDLVEIPIKHPSVDKSIKHRCVLVTNGRITDEVRVDVDDRNARFKQLGLPELEIVTGSDLLKRFIDVHGSFLPRQPTDFRLFLELFLFDGRELLRKKLFTKFIESVLLTEEEKELDLKRKIASSVLLSQYVLQPFESQMNHISIIEGWTTFCSYVLGLVEKYGLKDESWRQSYNIIMGKINYQLEALKSEFFSRKNYIEGYWDGGLFYRSRMTIVLGWLSAFELFNKQIDSGYEIDNRILKSVSKYYKVATWFWGESATPLFVMMSLLTHEHGETSLSNKIICDLIIDITSENRFRDGDGLPDPYYSVNHVIRHFYGSRKQRIDMSSFLGSSYHLAALVDILVRRNKRDLLGELWKHVSHIQTSELNPSPLWKSFMWRCDKGEQVEKFYKNPQSWKELREESMKSSDLDLPRTLAKNPFSHYFLICYPHRLNRHMAKLIDRSLE